jgi:hypothetical protein
VIPSRALRVVIVPWIAGTIRDDFCCHSTRNVRVFSFQNKLDDCWLPHLFPWPGPALEIDLRLFIVKTWYRANG